MIVEVVGVVEGVVGVVVVLLIVVLVLLEEVVLIVVVLSGALVGFPQLIDLISFSLESSYLSR